MRGRIFVPVNCNRWTIQLYLVSGLDFIVVVAACILGKTLRRRWRARGLWRVRGLGNVIFRRDRSGLIAQVIAQVNVRNTARQDARRGVIRQGHVAQNCHREMLVRKAH